MDLAIGDGVSAIASLGVTFGGFSPTAMDGVAATREQVERVEAIHAQRKAADKRRREIELARASTPRSFTDDEGMTWTYVVLDESFVRIDRCKREIAHVSIPAQVEGLPVRAIGPDLFHESEVVTEVTCPDAIESIGACAFRCLVNLRRVVFPASVSNYSASWLQQCDAIEEVVLPGSLDTITSVVFDNASLRRLRIGRSVMAVKPGACEKTQLEELVVDEANPFIFTDGDAIYTHDGTQLIALARPVASYEVREGCVSIAKKACMGIQTLTEVKLPESLQVVGEFAFAHTNVRSVEIPSSVGDIQAKAFYFCGNLEEVRLNQGLRSIGDSAFAESGLKALSIPASIERIGSFITTNTNVVHSGEGATFEISPDSPSLFFDGQGGLYRREDDGIHFIQLIDRELTDYRVFAGTVCIDERAFAFHEAIERVFLPEGVKEIRASAFRVCSRLRRVDIPESLVSIGKEAFLDTNLEAVFLPAGFEELSEDAFITAGAHRFGEPPTLRDIVVHEDNPRYYVESGLLCRRGAEGAGDRGIVFNDDVADVVIPDAVTSIAPFAFNNARNIATISIGPNLKTIGTSGLSTWCYITDIHLEVAEPIEGRSVFDVRFPDTPHTAHEISISLGGSAWVNVPDIFRHYDNCLAHAHDYNTQDSATSAYEQVRLIMARLKDPLMLVPVNRSVFERLVREHLIDICIDVARHDDRSVVDDLCDFGFLNRDNLEEVIVAVGRLQDAAMSGYLLELKRRRFGRAAFDFDL